MSFLELSSTTKGRFGSRRGTVGTVLVFALLELGGLARIEATLLFAFGRSGESKLTRFHLFHLSASYASHVRRFEISLERQAFPKKVLAELEHDASSAYPGLKLFKKDGAMYAGLREFLGAWVVGSTWLCFF